MYIPKPAALSKGYWGSPVPQKLGSLLLELRKHYEKPVTEKLLCKDIRIKLSTD